MAIALVAPGAANARHAPRVKPAQHKRGAHDETDIVIVGSRANHDPTWLDASAYHIGKRSIESRPGGSNSSLKSMLLQAPGVTQDSDNDGEIQIRNEHLGIQYRLNGLIIPESFADFGPLVDPRVAESVSLVSGALPAEFGIRTAGVVALKTSTDSFDFAGEASVYGGSNHLIQPSVTFRDAIGGLVRLDFDDAFA